jgi:hypothetical protein
VKALSPVRLVRVVQTCSRPASEWSAWDVHDNQYYLRYQYGYGIVTVESDSPRPLMIASFRTGGNLDGTISLEEFARQAGVLIEGAEVS